jgi:hypothetical protein
MPTRLSKKRLDEAENVSSLAARIVAQKTGQELPTPQPPPVREKNPAAVALGQLGAKRREGQGCASHRGKENRDCPKRRESQMEKALK